MAVDKVQPIKTESISSGGDSTDEYPTALDPQKDHIEAAGVVFDYSEGKDELVRVWRDGNHLAFLDGYNTSPIYLSSFLRDFYYQASEGVSSTTSSTYQDKTVLTTPSLAGTYRIGFSCELITSLANRRGQVRLYNSTEGAELCYHEARPSLGLLYESACGFCTRELSGVTTLKIQFASWDGLTTVTVRRARIELWKVG